MALQERSLERWVLLASLRQELALHTAVHHQHVVGYENIATDPLAPTLGGAPLPDTVTPVGLVSTTPVGLHKATPVAVAGTSRLWLLLGALLVLAFSVALVALRLRPNSSSRFEGRPVATIPVPVPTVAAVVAPAAKVLGSTPKPELLEAAEPAVDTVATKPAALPQEIGLDELKSQPKISKPRATGAKPTASSATRGAPMRVEEAPEQPWR